MEKLFAWMTDIHLNFLKDDKIPKWVAYVKRSLPEDTCGVFITGDISEAPELRKHLKMLERGLKMPIYYVLGNHDFWKSSVAQVEKDCKVLAATTPNLIYMSDASPIQLSEKTALVGHDGWYDARNGDWQTSGFFMMDWKHVQDYASHMYHGNWGPVPIPHMPGVVSVSRALADRAAAYVYDKAKEAFDKGNTHVVVLTHFPPFQEASRYQGKPSEEKAQPWYSSQVMGDQLLALSHEYPDCKITVFCGHTHEGYRHVEKSNLVVYVGGADYGNPHWAVVKLDGPDT